MHKEPIHRKYHHDELTFSLIYAFTENFCLPLSHDEVVHGKGSLLDQMPGDLWQKFANLRLLYGYMWTHPGKKLLFMGGEFGQWNEWNCNESLQWHLLQWESHQGVQRCLADLNALYRREPALHQVDFDWHGFEWIDCHNWQDSVLAFIRKAKDPNDYVIVLLQLHARAAARLQDRRAGGVLVRRDRQQRLDVLRRQRRRQRRRHPGPAEREPRPAGLDRCSRCRRWRRWSSSRSGKPPQPGTASGRKDRR